MRKIKSYKDRQKTIVVLAVIIFSAAGTALLLTSRANPSDYLALEAESASRTNVISHSDPSASGDQYIEFGAETAGSWQEAWDSQDYDTIRNWYLSNTGINAAGLTDSDLTPSGSIETSHDGQVIEGLMVNGGIRIKHNNVTVKNTKIIGTSIGVHVPYSARDTVDVVFVENVTILGDPAAIEAVQNDPVTYDAPKRGVDSFYAKAHIKNTYVWGRESGYRVSAGYDGDSIEYSMVENIITDSCESMSSGVCKSSHNTGISFRGGANKLISRNWIEGSSSSALSLYPDGAPITYATIQENQFDGGTYSIIGGNGSKTYADQTINNKIINNQFSRNYNNCTNEVVANKDSDPHNYEKFCSRGISRFDTSLTGNESYGNLYQNHDGTVTVFD